MIVAFSTSSPWASVALISLGGEVLWEDQQEAPRRASGACLAMLAEVEKRFSLAEATLFAADIGPGSFTGVRVGVILAKTFGFSYDKPVTGASAFDLISPNETVVLPSKKGEYFVRRPGQEPVRSTELEANLLGYGADLEVQTPPHARNFSLILAGLSPTTAEQFVPEYLIPPSISQPKKPFAT